MTESTLALHLIVKSTLQNRCVSEPRALTALLRTHDIRYCSPRFRQLFKIKKLPWQGFNWQVCKPQSQLFCFPSGLLYSSQSKTNIQSGTRKPYLIAAAVEEQKALGFRRRKSAGMRSNLGSSAKYDATCMATRA